MIFSDTSIKGLYVAHSNRISDHRGEFSRLYCRQALLEKNIKDSLVQINHSNTKKRGAIRGLHFQVPPKLEMKMVRCIQGEVFDVAVDLRVNSPTYLKWHGEKLSAETNNMMIIPEGFAHGFQSLTENVRMLYLHTEYYSAEYEQGLRFDEPAINIQWPLPPSDISERDLTHPYIDSDYRGINL
ncbi:dTDP-4-dehydrorhamnose 3,5-epimerase [Aliiglaciecola sp.]|nr:dTDP-4-dehydrorhamnose 3,5-epimerase [Aliiglaciecola sp.]